MVFILSRSYEKSVMWTVWLHALFAVVFKDMSGYSQSRNLQATDTLLMHVCLVYLTNPNDILSWGNQNISCLSICSHWFLDLYSASSHQLCQFVPTQCPHFFFLDYSWERMEIFGDSSFKPPSEREQQDSPMFNTNSVQLAQRHVNLQVQIERIYSNPLQSFLECKRLLMLSVCMWAEV